jgi:hypothetical protein
VTYDFRLLTDRDGDGARTCPEDYDFFPAGRVVGDPPGRPPRKANPEDSTIRTANYATHFDDGYASQRVARPASTSWTGTRCSRSRPDDPRPNPPDACVRTENTGAAGHGAFESNIDGPVRASRELLDRFYPNEGPPPDAYDAAVVTAPRAVIDVTVEKGPPLTCQHRVVRRHREGL